MASRISHQLWGHGKAQTPPIPSVPALPSARIPEYPGPHGVYPATITRAAKPPGNPSPWTPPGPPIPLHSHLHPTPLAIPGHPHLLAPLRSPAPPSPGPPRQCACPGAPCPAAPAPAAPRASLTGRRRRCRCGMRCAPLCPLCRPRGAPGAVVRHSIPERRPAGTTRFVPKNRGGDARGLLQQLAFSSNHPSPPDAQHIQPPWEGTAPPNLGIQGEELLPGTDAWRVQDLPPVLGMRCFTPKKHKSGTTQVFSTEVLV